MRFWFKKKENPNEEKFPAKYYAQVEDRPWMYVRKWDGRFYVDSNEFIKQDRVQEQMKQLRQRVEEGRNDPNSMYYGIKTLKVK